jgi:hypothetical protein
MSTRSSRKMTAIPAQGREMRTRRKPCFSGQDRSVYENDPSSEKNEQIPQKSQVIFAVRSPEESPTRRHNSLNTMLRNIVAIFSQYVEIKA